LETTFEDFHFEVFMLTALHLILKQKTQFLGLQVY
jgi:hypothetical protein